MRFDAIWRYVGKIGTKGLRDSNKASFDQSSMLRGCSTHRSARGEDIEVPSRHTQLRATLRTLGMPTSGNRPVLHRRMYIMSGM